MVSVPGRLVVPYNTHQHNHGGSNGTSIHFHFHHFGFSVTVVTHFAVDITREHAAESQCGGGCGTTDSDMLRCNGTAVHDAYGRRESLHQREVT
jgi:hypothetical protein